jgi:hypothetical protein
MSSSVLSDIKIRGEAEYLRSDKTRTANVSNFQKIRCVLKSRKSKLKFMYINQGKSLSHIKIRHANFSLSFPHF